MRLLTLFFLFAFLAKLAWNVGYPCFSEYQYQVQRAAGLSPKQGAFR